MDTIDRTIAGLRTARALLDRAILQAADRSPERDAAVDLTIVDAITALDGAFADWSQRAERSAEVVDLDRWRRNRSA